MNFVKRALLLTMVFLFFIEAQAQSVVELQQQLQQLQRQPAAIIDKLDPQEEEVVAYGRKLELARDDLGQAERDAEDAKKAASEALKQHKASTSQESERAMRLADHGYKMARRGVASRGKRVDRIERRYQQAILDQQKLVAKLRQAEADIRFVRVKLAKAQQQDRKRERQAAASRTPQAVGTAQVQSKSAAPAPKPEPKAELSKAAEAEAVNAKPAAERLSAYDRVAQREAMELQAEIDQDIINKSSRRPLYKRLTLKGRFVNAAQFKFIGADHYRAEAKIKAGAQQFEVARNRFSREIPAADDGETYIFFYQAKSASRGVLKLFKKSLLSPRAQSIGRE